MTFHWSRIQLLFKTGFSFVVVLISLTWSLLLNHTCQLSKFKLWILLSCVAILCAFTKNTKDAGLNSEGMFVEILPTWLPVLMCVIVDHIIWDGFIMFFRSIALPGMKMVNYCSLEQMITGWIYTGQPIERLVSLIMRCSMYINNLSGGFRLFFSFC